MSRTVRGPWKSPGLVVLAAVSFSLMLPGAARAQVSLTRGARPDSVSVSPARLSRDAFGTASSILSVGFPSFVAQSSATTWGLGSGNALYFYQLSSLSTTWFARLNLPGGAVIDSIELDACDASATGAMEFALASTDAGADAGAFLTPIGNTGVPAMPGCGLFSVTPFAAPLVVDNAAKNYWLELVFVGDFSEANEMTGIRVHYHLQVSPDPATATFTDVPVGHPQHRFVEALVAAGITAGCGGGNYCPTAPITRGQMAVFLAVALGLNFPN